MSMGFSQKIALPVFRRAVDQVEMGVGGRADHHGVDVVGGKDGLGAPDLGADLAASASAAAGTRRRRPRRVALVQRLDRCRA
jgi:hypothetical protein